MLIIEFFEHGNKVAECQASEVFDLPKEKQDSFWVIQDDRNREIKLRLDE